jgi:hypothetical protein
MSDLEAGPELDAAISREVFGRDEPEHLLDYSTSIASAWDIVDQVWSIQVTKCDGTFPSHTVVIFGRDGRQFFGEADSAPLAICRAALAAKRETR